MKNRKIVWESYHISEFDKSEKEKILEDVDRDELDYEDQETYDKIDSMIEVMDTPMGLLVKNDSMNVLNQVEHRICHTNFTISEKEAVRINFIEGVETLSIISRYRMLIGFGRLFDASEVRKEIELALTDMSTYSQEMFERD